MGVELGEQVYTSETRAAWRQLLQTRYTAGDGEGSARRAQSNQFQQRTIRGALNVRRYKSIDGARHPRSNCGSGTVRWRQ